MDVIDNDWVKLLFVNSGLMQNHNVTVNAGGEKLSMFTSLTFMDQRALYLIQILKEQILE